jgi:hypothetical protein
VLFFTFFRLLFHLSSISLFFEYPLDSCYFISFIMSFLFFLNYLRKIDYFSFFYNFYIHVMFRNVTLKVSILVLVFED